MDQVCVPNRQSLDDKIRAIKQAGPDSLHVLSDFDRTLTKGYVNGKKIWSLLAILRDHFMLTPDYPAKAKALAEKYLPIERDPNVPQSEKKTLMREWWTEHFALLVASGLTKADIEKALAIGGVELRDGAEGFFRLLHQHGIPLVIMSASGIGGDAISMFLAKQGVNQPNVHVIGNRIIWNNAGKATGVQEPIIHSLNKDETAIQDFPAFRAVEHRKNVILLGDFADDVGMVTGFAYDHLVTVGFLNEDADKNLPEFQKFFDIIITGDGPMEAINKIIRTVVQ